MIVIASREEKELLQRLRQIEGHAGTAKYAEEGRTLRSEIETLKIEKDRMKETQEREKRDLTHMIGLEKKRQEVEIEQTKKDTALTIREGNLASEKARFEEHLKFNTERFQSMETYLKDMMTSILARLPNVTMAIEQKGRR